MRQRRLGHSGLRVSRLGLGTMTWGRDTDEHEARDLLHTFLEAGGSLLDTADRFSEGAAEAVVGDLLSGMGVRDDLVVVVRSGRGLDGRDPDTSRRHLLASLNDSLQRLCTEHADLWLFDGWDTSTPMEEALSAADAAVSSGRARYVGMSGVTGWQLAATAAHQQALPGGTPLVAASVEYSLLARDAERELLPAAAAMGMGALAVSPLGRGALTGKYRHGVPADSRAASPHLSAFVEPYLTDSALRVVDAVATAAEGLGVAPAEVALAWVADRPGVGSAVLGPRTAAQLRGLLTVEDVSLPAEIRCALDDVSADRETAWTAGPAPTGPVDDAS
jgi:aryl-alcohol dehydrogenase-like predicted oxidoreductase